MRPSPSTSFCGKEYPGSKYRCDALFTIGEIYKDDLNDPEQARAVFQEFLHRYPHNRLVDDAQQAIAELDREAEAEKKAEAQQQKKAGKESCRARTRAPRTSPSKDADKDADCGSRSRRGAQDAAAGAFRHGCRA